VDGPIHRRLTLVFALCAWATVAHAQPGTPSPRPASNNDTSASANRGRILSMEATVNGVKSGTWLFLEQGGVLFAPKDALDEWRVEANSRIPRVQFKGQSYVALNSIPGYRSKIDFASQSVELFFSPEAFSLQRIAAEKIVRPAISPTLPSAFVNYDINYAASSFRGAPSTNDLGMVTEVGLSNSWGVLTSSQVGRNLLRNRTLGEPRLWLRLETTFTKDFPEQNRTLRIGDSTTRAGMWGRNAYFGGIQFGSNFALTPGFIRQPLPVLSGVSAAPSTVELYVNDVLRQVSSVPTGPFSLDNFPVMTGGGEARLVVRDLLGRETVIVQSFLSSTQLLAKGLNDWSFEAGTLRHDLGVASNRYGKGFVSGTWSRGLGSGLTFELRGELTRELRNVGLGLVSTLPGQFLGKTAVVASHEDAYRAGHYWLVGLERQGLRSSFNFEVRGASQDFRQLGLEANIKPFKYQVAANWSASLDDRQSFGVGVASISQFDDARVTTVSGNYTLRIGERSSFNVTASRAIAGASGSAVGMSLFVPLDGNRALSSSANHHSGQTDGYVAATQNPVGDNGLGWRVLAGHQQKQARAEGGAYFLGRYGRATADLSVSPDFRALRMGASGGMVLADSRLFVTRRVDDSFAIAEIKGYGDIGVGLGSNMLARTDANGIALIPRLIPYMANSVRINPAELPISAEIDSIEQMAVPAWRSAVKVSFPVRTGRGALIKIVLDDKEVAPAGAIVSIEGDNQEFYVARRGEAFVTGLQPANRLQLKWNSQQCKFEVKLPPEKPNEVVRLGPLLCKGVKR